MTALLTAIVIWLSANFELPRDLDHPSIKFMSSHQISDLRYKDIPVESRRPVVAIYDNANKTIILPDTWTGKNSTELSILVHEMVHHLQNSNKSKFTCAQEREKLAFIAQEKWLNLFNTNLQHEFGIDALTLLVSTNC